MARPRSYPYGTDIRSPHLSFAAGDSCLNFANTRELRKGEEPQEYLLGYEDLLVFCQRIELLRIGEVRSLRRQAARTAAAADSVFAEALRLREAIYRTMSRAARRSPACGADVELIDRLWQKAVRRSQLRWCGGHHRRSWSIDGGDLAAVWWRLAHAAVSLLCSQRLELVRECGGPDCGWLFLDTSRNKRRRWCSMKTCGNRAKAARHYARIA